MRLVQKLFMLPSTSYKNKAMEITVTQQRTLSNLLIYGRSFSIETFFVVDDKLQNAE